MEKLSLLDIFLVSWRLSLSRRIFFVFGFFIALPAVVLITFSEAAHLTNETLLSFISLHPLITGCFLLWYFFFVLFGKSNLIVALQKKTLSEHKKNVSPPQLGFFPFKKALALDGVILGFLVVLIVILALPAILSSALYGTIPSTLLFLGQLTFFPIIIMGYFIREFSYFYFLLSPLRLKPSFEAGSALFLRYRFFSLAFGGIFFLFSILFTYSINIAMLGTVTLWSKAFPGVSAVIFLFVGNLIFFVWYEIFRQSLWFTFFKNIATPKEPLPKKVVSAPLEEKVTEVPTI